MKNDHIIFVKYSQLTKQDYNNRCMGALLKEGYKVDYWDVSELMKVHLPIVEKYDPKNNLNVLNISSYRDFKKMVCLNKDAIYISLMSCGLRVFKILWILKRNGCKFGNWGPDPVPYERKTTLNKIKGITFKKVWYKIGAILFKGMLKSDIVSVDYLFYAGRRGYLQMGLGYNIEGILKKINCFPVNSSDYNNFIYNQQEKIIEEDYIVFIDEYYPFHPDADILGEKKIPADTYFNMLNKSFSVVERVFNKKIVIAAHPKAILYRDHNYFEGRQIFWGVTSSLVKYASLVISHDSTAIDYAVMARKPIILFNSFWFKHNFGNKYHSICSFSNQLDLPILMMDSDYSDDFVRGLICAKENQIERQNNYLYNYCTSREINQSNEKLLMEYMNSLFSY